MSYPKSKDTIARRIERDACTLFRIFAGCVARAVDTGTDEPKQIDWSEYDAALRYVLGTTPSETHLRLTHKVRSLIGRWAEVGKALIAQADGQPLTTEQTVLLADWEDFRRREQIKRLRAPAGIPAAAYHELIDDLLSEGLDLAEAKKRAYVILTPNLTVEWLRKHGMSYEDHRSLLDAYQEDWEVDRRLDQLSGMQDVSEALSALNTILNPRYGLDECYLVEHMRSCFSGL